MNELCFDIDSPHVCQVGLHHQPTELENGGSARGEVSISQPSLTSPHLHGSEERSGARLALQLHGLIEILGLVPRTINEVFFFWLVAAWVKSRAERPSVSGVNRQLHVQIGCKLGIRNRKDELTKQAKRNKLQIKPEGN